MKGNISPKISFLLILIVVLYSNSCTVMFGLIGNTEDRTTPDVADTVTVSELEKIKVGSQVIINLKDESIISGKYLGIDSIPNKEYAEKYVELQKQMPEGSFLPSIGDTISCVTEYGRNDDIKFLGFIENNIVLSFIQFHKPEKLRLEHLIKIMDKHGNETEGETVRNLMAEGKIPVLFLSRISIKEHIEQKDVHGEDIDSIVGKKLIYINDIDRIQTKAVKQTTRNLAITGCIIDLGIIAGVVWFMIAFGNAL